MRREIWDFDQGRSSCRLRTCLDNVMAHIHLQKVTVSIYSARSGGFTRDIEGYLDILQALFIVFTVQPWHHNIARTILQSPKVYFFDTGVVRGD